MEKEIQEDKVECLPTQGPVPAQRVMLLRGMKGFCNSSVGTGTLAVPPHRMPVRGQKRHSPYMEHWKANTPGRKSLLSFLLFSISCWYREPQTGRTQTETSEKGDLECYATIDSSGTGQGWLGLEVGDKTATSSSFYRSILVFMVYLLA